MGNVMFNVFWYEFFIKKHQIFQKKGAAYNILPWIRTCPFSPYSTENCICVGYLMQTKLTQTT